MEYIASSRKLRRQSRCSPLSFALVRKKIKHSEEYKVRRAPYVAPRLPHELLCNDPMTLRPLTRPDSLA